jgi:hypothetical protein
MRPRVAAVIDGRRIIAGEGGGRGADLSHETEPGFLDGRALLNRNRLPARLSPLSPSGAFIRPIVMPARA